MKSRRYTTREALTGQVIDLRVLSRSPRARKRRAKPVARYSRYDSVKINTLFMIAGASTLGLWIAIIK